MRFAQLHQPLFLSTALRRVACRPGQAAIDVTDPVGIGFKDDIGID